MENIACMELPSSIALILAKNFNYLRRVDLCKHSSKKKEIILEMKVLSIYRKDIG